jgi:hypothetical protein
MSRFEFEEMNKTYIQDAHKPWSGHIQGTYYVGAPKYTPSSGVTVDNYLLGAPEDFHLRDLPLAEPYLPGRPLGVKPWPPYRRPFGIESSSPPYYDYGYNYPAEQVRNLKGSVPGAPGINELPAYFGAVEGQVIAPLDLEPQLHPNPVEPNWSHSFEHGPIITMGAPILAMEDPLRADPWSPDWLAHAAVAPLSLWDSIVNWFKGLFAPKNVYVPPTTDVIQEPVVTPQPKVLPPSSCTGEWIPGSVNPDCAPGYVVEKQSFGVGQIDKSKGEKCPSSATESNCRPSITPGLISGGGGLLCDCVEECKHCVKGTTTPTPNNLVLTMAPASWERARSNAILGMPRMVPRPDVPFWAQPVQAPPVEGRQGARKDSQNSPLSAYGVTKVIDTIIQDYPVDPYPEAPEELAYMPCGPAQPFGLSTISKSK